MDPVTFWNLFTCSLGVGGIAFAGVMFCYFLGYGREAAKIQKQDGCIRYSSIALSSVMILGIFICFVAGMVVLVSGILALLCD